MTDHNLLQMSVVLLSAAVVLVPLAQRLGLGSVLGYLLAGIVVGPCGLGIITAVDDILHFSEFGVVLLLFLIGLELNPQKLWQMRRPILGLGGAQVILTMLAIGIVSYCLGLDEKTSLVVAMGLALSSTAIALKLINEQALSDTPAGHSAFSVLLFQDIAVIPMIALLPVLAGEQGGSIEDGVLKLLGLIGVLIAGRYLLKPLFRTAITHGGRELFTVAALLVIMAVAMLMKSLDLSMALGAFIAGVLLAESEFRHELESAIEPFKGLLLGLFFIAIGMTVDLGVLEEYLFEIIGIVLVLITIKSVIIYWLAKWFSLRTVSSATIAVLLSQGGEFAFVLFGTAKTQGLLSEDIAMFLLVTVSVSMVTTPFLLILTNRWFLRSVEAKNKDSQDVTIEQEDSERPSVIISGFGRFGQIVGRLMYANKIKITIFEKNVSQVALLRRYGYKVYYGDATQLDLLRIAGAEHAKAIVLCGRSSKEIHKTIQICKSHFPHLKILARARGRVEAHEFLKERIEYTRETFLGALDLGRKALIDLGMHPYQAKRAERHFRRLDMQLLKDSPPVDHNDTDAVAQAIRAREELEVVFSQELEIDKQIHSHWKETS